MFSTKNVLNYEITLHLWLLDEETRCYRIEIASFSMANNKFTITESCELKLTIFFSVNPKKNIHGDKLFFCITDFFFVKIDFFRLPSCKLPLQRHKIYIMNFVFCHLLAQREFLYLELSFFLLSPGSTISMMCTVMKLMVMMYGKEKSRYENTESKNFHEYMMAFGVEYLTRTVGYSIQTFNAFRIQTFDVVLKWFFAFVWKSIGWEKTIRKI